MRIGRVVFGVVAIGCVGFAAYAEPVVRPRPTHAEAVTRVDDGVVALDTSSSGSTTVNCVGAGTMSATWSAAVTSTGAASGTGTVTINATLTNCKGSSGDSLSGNITYTFTTSAPSPDAGKATTSTSTITYTGGTLKVVGPNAGTYAPAGLVVTTVQPPSSSTPPQSTLNGSATIDGSGITFTNDSLPPK